MQFGYKIGGIYNEMGAKYKHELKRRSEAIEYEEYKKMADGKSTGQPGATPAQQKYYDANKAKGDAAAKKADYEAFGSRGDAAKKGMEEGRMDALGNPYKKGGKIKKFDNGGLTQALMNAGVAGGLGQGAQEMARKKRIAHLRQF